jgi:hypothetical protein
MEHAENVDERGESVSGKVVVSVARLKLIGARFKQVGGTNCCITQIKYVDSC